MKRLAPLSPWFVVALSVLGLFFTGYLTNQYYLMNLGGLNAPSICSINALFDCDSINASSYSNVKGFPLSSLGLGLYFVFICLAVMMKKAKPELGRVLVSWLVTLSFLALLIDIYLAFVLLFVLKVICLFCLSTYIINAFVFVLVLWFMPEEIKMEDLKESLSTAFGSLLSLFDLKNKTLFCALGLVLIFSLTLGSSYGWKQHLKKKVGQQVSHSTNHQQNSQQNSPPLNKEELKRTLAKMWQQMPKVSENLELDRSPSHGPENAPIVMVEFSDFECPFCQKASHLFQEIADRHPQSVRFVFKNFPLSPKCNSQIKRDMHPKACLFAKASVCARKQPPFDYFWNVHDMIFAQGPRLTKETLADEAEKIGLKRSPFLKCLDSEAAKQEVAQDIDLGVKIGVSGTPTLFVNGKRLPNPGLPIEAYDALIEVLLESGA